MPNQRAPVFKKNFLSLHSNPDTLFSQGINWQVELNFNCKNWREVFDEMLTFQDKNYIIC